MGAGYFRVWYKGGVFEEELVFGPYGGTFGKRCELGALCNGELEEELDSTWWIRIRAPDDTEGWTKESEHFDGTYGCG